MSIAVYSSQRASQRVRSSLAMKKLVRSKSNLPVAKITVASLQHFSIVCSNTTNVAEVASNGEVCRVSE